MDVLALVHTEDAGAELFGAVVTEAGHRLHEWRFASQGAPPLERYGAVIVFGGSMHVDQEDRHPWLQPETDWLRALVVRGVPTLGICLGSQLLARAAGSWAAPLPQPEIGWHVVELTGAAASDPLLSVLPPRFEALEWHYYAHGLPAGAVELARSAACLQAVRLGERC